MDIFSNVLAVRPDKSAALFIDCTLMATQGPDSGAFADSTLLLSSKASSVLGVAPAFLVSATPHSLGTLIASKTKVSLRTVNLASSNNRLWTWKEIAKAIAEEDAQTNLNATHDKLLVALGATQAALAQAMGHADSLFKFVERVAALGIWEYDDDSGQPIEEITEPDTGFLDSHNCLMDLIEKARSIMKGKS